MTAGSGIDIISGGVQRPFSPGITGADFNQVQNLTLPQGLNVPNGNIILGAAASLITANIAAINGNNLTIGGNGTGADAYFDSGANGQTVRLCTGWGYTTQKLLLGGATTNPIGFYGHAQVAQQTVTGSKGANAALTSLMTALAALGLVVDSTT